MNQKDLETACEELAEQHDDLALIYRQYGVPPLWDREEGFSTLIQIILEQQVSLASAAAAFSKLKDKVGVITPARLIELSDEEFKACYFSRQKTGYARDLASALLEGRLDLAGFAKSSDEEVREELMKVKGIGIWTSDIYLLMALLRPDVMPVGDIALHAAYRDINNLSKRPASEEFAKLSKKWKPWRSVAARLLWHHYLSSKKLTLREK